MKNKLISIKNHVSRHRFAYGVATGITGMTYIMYRNGQEWNEFLKEQGVYDAYYEKVD